MKLINSFFKFLIRKGINTLNIFIFILNNRRIIPFTTEVSNNIKIKSTRLVIGKHVRIGKNVHINCGELYLGSGIVISDNVKIENVGKVYIGNYTIIAENVFINGLKGTVFKIGNLSWIGRSSFLNASRNITIGNGTCIGIGSKVFTHGCWFEVAEGYKLNYKDVYIGNNVWLALNVIVQPGAQINDNVFVNSGSIVNGVLESGYIYAGIPSVKQCPINKIKKDVTISEKMQVIAYYISSRLIDSGWKGTWIKKIEYNRPYTFKKLSRIVNIMFISQDITNIPSTRGKFIYFFPQVSPSMRAAVEKSNSLLLIDLIHKVSYGSEYLEHLLLTLLRDFIFRFYPNKWKDEIYKQ
ncbi:hypothetical protein ES705_32437 [subsurface metagenome]